VKYSRELGANGSLPSFDCAPASWRLFHTTPKKREAQSALQKPDGGAVFFSGEALYAGRYMGTVEARCPADGRRRRQSGRRTIGVPGNNIARCLE